MADTVTGDVTTDHLRELAEGPVHRFADWPNLEILLVAAGAYTIWDGDQLLYVGMAGRRMTAQPDPEEPQRKIRGLRDRLNSHASGRRSGDQFCVYVCDRIVLPNLSKQDIRMIGSGDLRLDDLVKQHIREHLAYRYTVTPDAATARAVEAAIRGGALPSGKPLLNPT